MVSKYSKMKDKLAAELIEPYLMNLEGYPKIRFISQESCLKAMQAYHEARLKEITPADIEAWAKHIQEGELLKLTVQQQPMRTIASYLIEGAKAILNNEIKHIENEKN